MLKERTCPKCIYTENKFLCIFCGREGGGVLGVGGVGGYGIF